jgi:hypothetical protein
MKNLIAKQDGTHNQDPSREMREEVLWMTIC